MIHQFTGTFGITDGSTGTTGTSSGIAGVEDSIGLLMIRIWMRTRVWYYWYGSGNSAGTVLIRGTNTGTTSKESGDEINHTQAGSEAKQRNFCYKL